MAAADLLAASGRTEHSFLAEFDSLLSTAHAKVETFPGVTDDPEATNDLCTTMHKLLNDMNMVVLQILHSLHATRKSTSAPPSQLTSPKNGSEKGNQFQEVKLTPPPQPLNPLALTGSEELVEKANASTQVTTVTAINYSRKTMEACKLRKNHEAAVREATKYKVLSHTLTVDLAKLLHRTGTWTLLTAPADGEGQGLASQPDDTDPLNLSKEGLAAVHSNLLVWINLHAEGRLSKPMERVLDEMANIQGGAEPSVRNSHPVSANQKAAAQFLGSNEENVVVQNESWFLCRNCRGDGRQVAYNQETKELKAPAANVPRLSFSGNDKQIHAYGSSSDHSATGRPPQQHQELSSNLISNYDDVTATATSARLPQLPAHQTQEQRSQQPSTARVPRPPHKVGGHGSPHKPNGATGSTSRPIGIHGPPPGAPRPSHTAMKPTTLPRVSHGLKSRKMVRLDNLAFQGPKNVSADLAGGGNAGQGSEAEVGGGGPMVAPKTLSPTKMKIIGTLGLREPDKEQPPLHWATADRSRK